MLPSYHPLRAMRWCGCSVTVRHRVRVRHRGLGIGFRLGLGDTVVRLLGRDPMLPSYHPSILTRCGCSVASGASITPTAHCTPRCRGAAR
eukprot:scaffold66619_cov31-Phaeocystis_antarctica.AAC.1